jgi:hypothetical protein
MRRVVSSGGLALLPAGEEGRMQSRSGVFRLLTGAALATVASVLWLALFPDDALAGNVQCGDTITSDTTLEADLIGCPNNGIVIGATA